MPHAMSTAASVDASLYARSALLPTLKRAAAHPFYAQHWGPWREEIEALSSPESALDIHARLPAISKADLAGPIGPLVEAGDHLAEMIHSSGTGGTFSFRYRSARELETIRRLVPPAGAVSTRAPHRIGVRLASFFHGQPVDRASTPDTLWITVSIAADVFVEHAARLLYEPPRPFGGREPVHALLGPVADLCALTQCLLDMGHRPRDVGLKVLGVFGGRLSPSARAFVEDAWGVAVSESFSVSETAGGALVCPRCGALSFDAHLLPSVRPLARDAGGRGALQMTEVFPFGWCQPLVKFETGDVVEALDARDACGPLHVGALRQAGRLAASHFLALASGRDVCVGSNAIRDALEQPGVARAPAFLQLGLLRYRDALGAPYAVASTLAEHGLPTLRLRFRPAANASPDTAQRIEAQLRRAVPELDAALESRAAALRIEADPAVDKRWSK
jgi:phenylacetate-coenzyme A ligase PaaK-like adenylate-forming protein